MDRHQGSQSCFWAPQPLDWTLVYSSPSQSLGLPRFGWDIAMVLWGAGTEVAAGWRFIWFRGWFIAFLGSCHVVIFSMWLKEGKQLSLKSSASLSLRPSPITTQQLNDFDSSFHRICLQAADTLYLFSSKVRSLTLHPNQATLGIVQVTLWTNPWLGCLTYKNS